MHHHDLAVDIRACTNADYRNLEAFGNPTAQLGRYTFKQQHIGSVGFEQPCFFDYRVGRFRITTLDAMTTDAIDRLWGQTHVGTHRDAALGQQASGLSDPGTALELDDLCTGSHQASGVFEGLRFR